MVAYYTVSVLLCMHPVVYGILSAPCPYGENRVHNIPRHARDRVRLGFLLSSALQGVGARQGV